MKKKFYNRENVMKSFVYTLEFMVLIFVLAASVMATTSTSSSLVLNLINQDPDPAIAGDVMEARIGIQNNDAVSYDDLIVELIPEYPFTIVPGEDSAVDAGAIQAYQGYGGDTNSLKTVKYKIMVDKDVTAGTYEMKFKAYEKGSENSVQSSFDIDIKNKQSAEVGYIDKTILIPGKQTPVTFVINNVGSAPLRDLKFSWSNSDKIILPVGSDNTKYIKYIGVDESAKVEYDVIADSNADAGLYSLDLTLSYEDTITGEATEIETIAGIYVGGGTDFDLAYSENSGNEMSFTIANIGSNPAFSVSVIVPQQNGWAVSGANSVIIGNLNTGDYTVASFTLQRGGMTQISGSGQSGPSNITTQTRSNTQTSSQGSILKLQVAYTDTMGNRETVEKNVTMSQSSSNSTSMTGGSFNGQFPGRTPQQSFWSKYKTYILVLIIAAALVGSIIYYRKYRREKILNPKFRFKELFFAKESSERALSRKK